MLDEQSVHKLEGVHPDLVRVVARAAESKDIAFVVTEGVRSVKRQRELIAAGASTTLRSRHLTGHAVDLAVKVGDEIRWDWPLYTELAEAMKHAARNENVSIEWGGDWRSFKDGPHFQLPWSSYPL
jgi:peptidoglycan LD-endopeptidase CwlK